METDNTFQQPTPVQPSIEKQSFFRNLVNQKGNFIVVIGLIVIIFVVGIGAYLLGTKQNKSLNTTNNNLTQLNVTQTPTTTDSSNTSVNPAVNKVINVDRTVYIKDGDVYTYGLNTNQIKKLTSYGFNSWAILSPDNSKIAFLSIPESVTKTDKVSKGNGSFYPPYSYGDYYDVRNVWIINSDGTSPIQVTNDVKKRKSISWSSDSSKIVYEEEGSLIEYSLSNKNKITLASSGTSPEYSPFSSYLAYLTDDARTIALKLPSGEKRITRKDRASNVTWSQAEDKIFYTSLNQKNQQGQSSLGVKFSIWSYSISSGTEKQITDESANISNPIVSPDSAYIVAQEGSGYADAGNIDLSSVILKMNSDLSITKQIKLADFKGPDFFEKEKQDMYPADNVVWLNNKEFLIFLSELLDPKPNPRGIYKLNVENLTAERLLELQ